ncbi:hypothetical protein BLNAU_17867 [Blattamonas nauphoetae]|uniref:TFIIB-type domain-containing protein n=1 Tax=Blattamonas nauphoetae TaxID=2049346 RepID=A0ABQ9X6K5_9EUKA|nr:hypothetical protein BLNAU_17867 [Blattamonas nauphoetae]
MFSESFQTQNICANCRSDKFELTEEGFLVCAVCGTRSAISTSDTTVEAEFGTRLQARRYASQSSSTNPQAPGGIDGQKLKPQKPTITGQDAVVIFQGLLQAQVTYLTSEDIGVTPLLVQTVGSIWIRYLSLFHSGLVFGLQLQLTLSFLMLGCRILRVPLTYRDLISLCTRIPSHTALPLLNFHRTIPAVSSISKRRIRVRKIPTPTKLASQTMSLSQLLQPMELPPPNAPALFLRVCGHLQLGRAEIGLGLTILPYLQNETSFHMSDGWEWVWAVVATVLRVFYTCDTDSEATVRRRVGDIPEWNDLIHRLLCTAPFYITSSVDCLPTLVPTLAEADILINTTRQSRSYVQPARRGKTVPDLAQDAAERILFGADSPLRVEPMPIGDSSTDMSDSLLQSSSFGGSPLHPSHIPPSLSPALSQMSSSSSTPNRPLAAFKNYLFSGVQFDHILQDETNDLQNAASVLFEQKTWQSEFEDEEFPFSQTQPQFQTQISSQFLNHSPHMPVREIESQNQPPPHSVSHVSERKTKLTDWNQLLTNFPEIDPSSPSNITFTLPPLALYGSDVGLDRLSAKFGHQPTQEGPKKPNRSRFTTTSTLPLPIQLSILLDLLSSLSGGIEGDEGLLGKMKRVELHYVKGLHQSNQVRKFMRVVHPTEDLDNEEEDEQRPVEWRLRIDRTDGEVRDVKWAKMAALMAMKGETNHMGIAGLRLPSDSLPDS